ncbi:uncharacterized protein MONOS_5515 [Monocercomonoides exilis]|uniref:uncharacterized protein n=1 Tax=Monocercomonoides exilis TaxID=2049356 RepID=UPI00355A0A6B|nr:hypothetical protein MONOS_5515 [Monocercomonoides exilis]|eukprot:MONOS_5515.1-p1 / transcript=MONOS_5515.1 / gene=MONOS_5515 / organism=Monocercomonoides_exilis_PA203 / gene_product=unspecified product / transcript_product=unspecified product / location=Mono_scaffold00161:100350-103101(+) / protein_length=830 / sequence_SO=supercontig / SO=protein_coding / is_pseudo=false
MADLKGIEKMVRKSVLDGIESILVRCQSEEGLSDAISSLQIFYNATNEDGKSRFWITEYKSHLFEAVLTEIAVGNKIRGIARKKLNSRLPLHKNIVNVECEADEVDEADESVTECLSTVLSIERARIKGDANDDGGDDYCNDENRGEEEIEKDTYKTKESKQKVKGSKNNSKDKAITKGKDKKQTKEKKLNAKSKYSEAIIEPKRKQEEKNKAGACQSCERVSGAQKDREKPFLPMPIRIKAVLAMSNNDINFTRIQPIKNIMHLLMEGIRIPEGAEAEYLKRKKEMSEIDEDSIIKMMEDKLNINQIRNCIICIKGLIADYVYAKNSEFISENQLKTLVDLLIQLNKFPDCLFFSLSSSCIEYICYCYSNQMKQLYLSTFEEQLMEDLNSVEEEMKTLAQEDRKTKEKKVGEEEKEEEEETRTDYLQSDDFAGWNNDYNSLPFVSVRKLTDPKCLTFWEYNVDKSIRTRQKMLEDQNIFYLLTEMFSLKNIRKVGISINDSAPVIPFHFSAAAHRFNHSLSCIASIFRINGTYCDDVVIRPVFANLVNRMAHPFSLIAPISVMNLKSDTYCVQSLESVQISIDMFVLQTMVNVVHELPFAFAMGFEHVLFEWLAGGRDSNDRVLYYAIQIIRETCIVFMNIARDLRIKSTEIFNEKVDAHNNYKPKKMRDWCFAPDPHPDQCVSLLDERICYDSCRANCAMESRSKKPPPMKYVCFEEDAIELSKGEDIGACLLRLIDDEIEECGIRDVVEATPQRRIIQLFWLCSGVMPKADRNTRLSSFKRFKTDYLNNLPLVEFRIEPSNPLAKNQFVFNCNWGYALSDRYFVHN